MDSGNDQVADNESASSLSTEALIMALLGQIHSLEEERDNARLLAARMRDRLKHITVEGSNNEASSVNNTAAGNVHCNGVNRRLAKILREVTSNTVKDLQQITANEEQRLYNLKELAHCGTKKGEIHSERQAFESQLALYKEHYERLLEEAENDKLALRKKLKEQRDLVLDRDIKIKQLELQLNNTSIK